MKLSCFRSAIVRKRPVFQLTESSPNKSLIHKHLRKFIGLPPRNKSYPISIPFSDNSTSPLSPHPASISVCPLNSCHIKEGVHCAACFWPARMVANPHFPAPLKPASMPYSSESVQNLFIFVIIYRVKTCALKQFPRVPWRSNELLKMIFLNVFMLPFYQTVRVRRWG